MVQNKLLKLALALVYSTSKNNVSHQQFSVLLYIVSASESYSQKHIRFKNHNISFGTTIVLANISEIIKIKP